MICRRPHFGPLVLPLAAMNLNRQNQMVRLITGIDVQIAESEVMLLETVNADDIRRIVERIASLKVVRQNLQIAMNADQSPARV